MRWLALNGSPRGPRSNTHIMLEEIRAGMTSVGQVEWEEIYLSHVRVHGRVIERLPAADGILFAYPLYTDSMPGIAVQFVETLLSHAEAIERLRARRVPAAFLLHSGFPDGVHTAHLEDVHRRLCEELGLRYAGTIRKPGSEGTRLMPRRMLRSLFERLRAAGAALAAGNDIDAADAGRLIRFERFGPMGRVMMRIGATLGTINVYWMHMLRKHGAFDRRFDAPYGPPCTRK